MESTKEMVSTIANIIQDYTAQEGRSLRQIEYYSGVSYGYVSRLANAQIPYEKIDPVKLFQIIKVAKNISSAYEMVGTNSDWIDKIKRVIGFGKDLGENAVEDRSIEQTIISSDERILAFLLSCNHCGTSEKQLLKVGGPALVKAAQDLKEKGILVEKSGIIKDSSNRTQDGWFYTFSRESYKRINAALNSVYDPNRKPPIGSDVFTTTESCSKEFMDRLEEKMTEMRNWIDIEKVKPENKGNHPFFFTMTKDVFYDEQD